MNSMFKNICRLAAVATVLATTAGCGLYGKFETPEYEETASAYGNIEVKDSTNTGDLYWRDFFGDDILGDYIDTALTNNVNMVSAVLKIQEAQASLKTTRLAYIPSLSFSPSETYTSDMDGYESWSTSIPVSASWTVDIFGSLTNAKRKQLAATMSSVEYARSVRASLVATVASQYYTLLALDAEYEIYKQTEANWKENVEVTENLMEAGKYRSTAVHQAKANYYSVCNNLVDIEQQILAAENQLNSLLGRVSGTPIERGTLADWNAPECIEVGIPAEVLANRPDVRQAELTLAQYFYATNAARSAFYPAITLTGSVSVYETLANAVASLVQPLFQQGKLIANLKIAKAQYEEAEGSFKQAIIDAGIEVNNAMTSLKTAQQKTANYAEQVYHLEQAVEGTTALMTHSSTTYLEVLTAQQSLLSAQIGEISNKLSEITASITLYQALGGGCE